MPLYRYSYVSNLSKNNRDRHINLFREANNGKAVAKALKLGEDRRNLPGEFISEERLQRGCGKNKFRLKSLI